MGSYNLLHEQWIPALYADGRYERVGIAQAVREVGGIRQIASSNSMDLFALHRFLLTLLYWNADVAGGIEDLRRVLLGGKMPSAIMDAIETEAGQFALFDAKRPFLQDVSVAGHKSRKSAGSLFAEIPSGTNVAHFDHGDDVAMRMCLPCATMGLLRLVPWSQSGGQGLTPSVHNAPPIMAMAWGRNLAETLGLNLVPLKGEAGTARWSGEFRPTDINAPIPYLEAFTWNPRRVHLGAVEKIGKCWRCGKNDVPVIGRIVYDINGATKLRKRGKDTIPFQWQDPAAFYREKEPYVTVKSGREGDATKEADIHVLAGKDAPVARVALANPHNGNWVLIVPCTNPANNKSYDHRLVRTTSFAPEALQALIPANESPTCEPSLDGWIAPQDSPQPVGLHSFIAAAINLFTHDDWAVLNAAASKDMHESPAAFDLLSGLLWGLREKSISGLPSRRVGWLVLKLLAAVPSSARNAKTDGGYCPFHSLPKRQIDVSRNGRGCRTRYPLSLPSGQRLEAALRAEVTKHVRSPSPRQINWVDLLARLEQVLR